MKKDTRENLLVCFLPWFMWCIFGPLEIYMGNSRQFSFGYGKFLFLFLIASLIGSVLLTFLLTMVCKKSGQTIMTFLFATCLGSYVQIMFLNQNLDQLGVTPDGYEFSKRMFVKNSAVWGCIYLLMLIILIKKKEVARKIVVYGSGFLLAIQMIAFVSLFFMDTQHCFQKKYDDVWYLNDEKQFTVSAKQNVILIILDYFSNQYIEPMLEQYPDALDALQDFTYYDNNDSVYFGTFPSLAHIATGQNVDPTVPVDDWFQSIWSVDQTKTFYKALQDEGYRCYFYTNDSSYLCGSSSIEMLTDYFENISHASFAGKTNYPLLIKTMSKMSAYRAAPYAFKQIFYTSMSEYSEITDSPKDSVTYLNSSFYERVRDGGLTIDDENKLFAVQHLMGAHEYHTAADGTEKMDATLVETTRGCMSLVEAYLNELKKLGVYDCSTVIITSDHGGPKDSQGILFVKYANEQHEHLMINHAPVSLNDLQATLAKAAGLEWGVYGRTFDEIPEGEERERTVYVRELREDYPLVRRYDSNQNSTLNVYSGYTYTGDINELFRVYENGPTVIIPQYDSFY